MRSIDRQDCFPEQETVLNNAKAEHKALSSNDCTFMTPLRRLPRPLHWRTPLSSKADMLRLRRNTIEAVNSVCMKTPETGCGVDKSGGVEDCAQKEGHLVQEHHQAPKHAETSFLDVKETFSSNPSWCMKLHESSHGAMQQERAGVPARLHQYVVVDEDDPGALYKPWR